MKTFLVLLLGIFVGMLLGYVVLFHSPLRKSELFKQTPAAPKTIIGFLPYWLISKANPANIANFSSLTYFGLTVDTDGHIKKLATETETEPGWLALKSGKLSPFFNEAKKNNVDLSLLIFSGNNDVIGAMIANPQESARNLMGDVAPVMKKYNFTDLNLDIESTQVASDAARQNFTTFVKAVRQELVQKNLGTLTIEISGDNLIKKYLIDTAAVTPLADHMVLMAYDFHFLGSQVTGPVAPLSGAGTLLEYDTTAAASKALAVIPRDKLILGIPTYGYGWETILDIPHAAVLPSSGITVSSQYMENFLSHCATCSAVFDDTAKESYVIYKDTETGTYHQVFYPDEKATSAKVDFVNAQELGGIAVWALGYEGKKILEPLNNF